ncbi:hypothetical protein QFC21_005720 [Naganishia friedmannii]|uniref:Uncharacterized protein n=1 Tax=Naganishia friedmannii TaxID=89922 RepID=A0ACC2V6E7_9TREE|nr:hypothetical protein QFC21_005720 [Naganishia friedmannii]
MVNAMIRFNEKEAINSATMKGLKTPKHTIPDIKKPKWSTKKKALLSSGKQLKLGSDPGVKKRLRKDIRSISRLFKETVRHSQTGSERKSRLFGKRRPKSRTLSTQGS